MSKYRNRVFTIAFASMLGSIAGVLKVVSIESPFYRLSVYEIPVIISGLTLGPIFGGIVGLIADIFQMLYKGYPISLMTLSSMLWGIIPGFFFFFRKYIKDEVVSNIIMAIFIIITSVIVFGVNTYQLYLWRGVGVFAEIPPRLITATIKLPIEIFVSITIYYIYLKLMKQGDYILE